MQKIIVKFLNPITFVEEELVYGDNWSYSNWITLNGKLKDNPIDICNKLLIDRDSRIGGFSFEKDPNNVLHYKKWFIDAFYYYLLKIDDYILFNKLLDKFIDVHQSNIIFDYVERNKPIIKANKSTKRKTSKLSNKFYRQETKDIFGVTMYIYTNPVTKEVINSYEENLLDTLNAKPKRKNVIELKNMTFRIK